MKKKPIEKMDVVELRKEVERLREGEKKWVIEISQLEKVNRMRSDVLNKIAKCLHPFYRGRG